jgi:uncharacterized OB-fold protein
MEATYLGMPLLLTESEQLQYFAHCAGGQFHLQRCEACAMLRYPPTTTCPFCMAAESSWAPVDGRGAVHSYVEVHHAIQPAFKAHLPYLVLLVELETQHGRPGPHDALRVVGNLVRPDGTLASQEQVRAVGIGTRVRMVFSDVAPGLSLPQWTLDESAVQPVSPWRADF